jgi:hypothetical protein
MNFTETMRALANGCALERRTYGSLSTLERNASTAIDAAREGNHRAAVRSIRRMHSACDRIDRNAEILRFEGALGFACEYAHMRCAEAAQIVGAEYLDRNGEIARGAMRGFR